MSFQILWYCEMCTDGSETNFRVPHLHKTQRRHGRWTYALARKALLHWHGGMNDGISRDIIGQVIATGKVCITFVLRIHHRFSQKLFLKRGQFPENCKNHFLPMSKSSPIVYTTYGHVSYAAILYTKPKGPYFHHIKSHRDWSSHSGVEICA